MDERIREYLLFRGLNSTLKTLDAELRQEKDKGFRVDKILEQIHSYITGFDIAGFNEYWLHLEANLFAHLDAAYGACVRKLHTSLLRICLIGAVQAGRNDRVNEFFERMTPHIHGLVEWKDWFMLPYTRNPEDHPMFAMFFNKQWQDTVFLSLHNFLSIIVNSRKKAAVCNYEQDMKTIRRLEEQSALYRRQIEELLSRRGSGLHMIDDHISSANDVEPPAVNQARPGLRGAEPGEVEEGFVLEWEDLDTKGLPPVDLCAVPNSVELMDDFHAISQSKILSNKPRGKTGQIKTFIKSFAIPSSPILGKKPNTAPIYCSSTSNLSSSVPTSLPTGPAFSSDCASTDFSTSTGISTSAGFSASAGFSTLSGISTATGFSTSAVGGTGCANSAVAAPTDSCALISSSAVDFAANTVTATSAIPNATVAADHSGSIPISVHSTGAKILHNYNSGLISFADLDNVQCMSQPAAIQSVADSDNSTFADVAAAAAVTHTISAAGVGTSSANSAVPAPTNATLGVTIASTNTIVDTFAANASASNSISTSAGVASVASINNHPVQSSVAHLMRGNSNSTLLSSTTRSSQSDTSETHAQLPRTDSGVHEGVCVSGVVHNSSNKDDGVSRGCVAGDIADSIGNAMGGAKLNEIQGANVGGVEREAIGETGLNSGVKTESSSIKPPGIGAKLSPETDVSAAYLLLSQEVYSEHTSCVVQCRFSSSGQTVATLDADGVLKAWTIQPTPVTLASTMSQSSLTALEWAANSDNLILLGSKIGSIRLFDIKEKKNIKEVSTDATCPRFISIASHPMGLSFTCSSSGRLRSSIPLSDISAPRVGKLSIWDFKTMKVERYLPLSPGPIAINSIVYDSGSGTSILTGAADGVIRLFDVRSGACARQWLAHKGEINTTLFSPDHRSCYSLGADGKLMHWSLGGEPKPLAEMAIHAGASGPFVTLGGGPGIPQRLAHSPRDKLFALDSDGKHMLTCTQNGGLIYKIDRELGLMPSLSLEGHRSPVICVDWSSSVHYKTCLTAGVDGQITVSTLLIQ